MRCSTPGGMGWRGMSSELYADSAQARAQDKKLEAPVQFFDAWTPLTEEELQQQALAKAERQSKSAQLVRAAITKMEAFLNGRKG